MVDNVVLYPNCDLHMTVDQAPNLALRVVRQKDHPDPAQHRYLLTTVPFNQCAFDWFRPYDPTGHRLDDKPDLVPGDGVTTTAVVTRATPGIYLFQVRVGTEYLVGRLQVHRQVVSWWFGNESITTAKDPIAHAQPSLYAKFSADDTGVDLIGDITGHGFVKLASSDLSTFTVAADDRLFGLRETTDPNHLPTVSGTWLALGPRDTPSSIPVRVVDYTAPGAVLETVRAAVVDDTFPDKHNIVFLAEGFRPEDKDLFNRLVQQAADEIFTKPRHEPYPLLERSFNVFKAFTPSVQRTLTCGFAVKDKDSTKIRRGTPLPFEDTVGADGTYRMNDLIRRVGLPTRREPADMAGVLNQWISQGLPGPDPNLDLNLDKVDGTLISEWREHRADGILNARDTFFGLHTGSRLGDRFSDVSRDPVTGRPAPLLPPAVDRPQDQATRDFVHRLYEFYISQVSRAVAVHLDRRRHPPELYSFPSETNPNNAVVRYLGGLRYTTLAIGPEWVPIDGAFKRSRGLVVMLCLDDHQMGQNINKHSLTALSGGTKPTVDFAQEADKQMRRTPPDTIAPDLDEIVSTVAHELGHSFNLDDEYENSGGGPRVPDGTIDADADNITHFSFISARDPNFPDDIDPDRVKWLAVPRTFLSSRLTAASQAVASGLRIPINPQDVGQWTHARTAFPGLQLALRSITYDPPPTRQLPQSGPLLAPLTIVDIDPGGAVVVAGPGIPPANPIPAGSLLWVPLGDKAGGLQLSAVEPKVLEFLRDTHQPLNRDSDTSEPNPGKDKPKLIRGFRPPCKSFRVVGVYEGAEHFAANFYRPAGGCKMRDVHDTSTRGGQFCFICKWLIVNRVDPGMHAILTDKFYPNAKSSDNG